MTARLRLCLRPLRNSCGPSGLTINGRFVPAELLVFTILSAKTAREPPLSRAGCRRHSALTVFVARGAEAEVTTSCSYPLNPHALAPDFVPVWPRTGDSRALDPFRALREDVTVGRRRVVDVGAAGSPASRKDNSVPMNSATVIRRHPKWILCCACCTRCRGSDGTPRS